MAHKPTQIDFSGTVSKTDQSQQAQSDINNILASYLRGAPILSANHGFARYEDFSEAPDFQEAQNIVARATSQFAELPSKIRERFNHDARAFLDWIHDKNNLAEAAELGLLHQDAKDRIKAAAKNKAEGKAENKAETK